MKANLITAPLVDLSAIDVTVLMNLVRKYPTEHLSPADMAIAEAAIALQKAITYRDVQCAVIPEEPTFEEQQVANASIARAYASLAYTDKTGSLGWGVKRKDFPKKHQPGEVVIINYFSNGPATVAAEIHDYTDLSNGRGLILKLLETKNSFGLGDSGWKYIGFYIPKFPTAQGGFTLRTEEQPQYTPSPAV